MKNRYSSNQLKKVSAAFIQVLFNRLFGPLFFVFQQSVDADFFALSVSVAFACNGRNWQNFFLHLEWLLI